MTPTVPAIPAKVAAALGPGWTAAPRGDTRPAGCHRLIQAGHAHLATGLDDVLQLLGR